MSNIRLKDIAVCQTGPFGSQLHESDYVPVGTPIVTVEHLGEISFTHNNLPFVSEEDTNRLSKYLLKEGDIVFSRVGSVDRNTYVKKAENGWLFSGRCIRVRIDETKANSKFISFYFRQRFFKEMMLNISVGATMPSLNTSLMDDILLNVPDLPTQKKIASVLSALDDKIELNNKINSELEAMAKTLYDYWFVQFEFPNTEGKPYKSSGGKMEYNPILKREIPEGWEVERLDKLLIEFTKGITTSYVEKSNLINLNQKVNKGSFLERQYFKYLDESVEIPKSKFAKNGDILINSLGQGTLGRVHYFIDYDNNIVVDQHLFILRTNNKITSSYLYNTLNSKAYQIQIERQITGSTGMQMLNASNLKDLQILKPDLGVSNKYESLVSKFYNRISINEKQNQELAQLRDWLLPMLMNGQVSVGNTNHLSEDVLNKAEAPLGDYKVKNISTPNKITNMDEKFENWVASQGLAARGKINITTLREIFDAMDDEDK